jgi:outer membrane receptor protein involved in Fe transport
MVTRYNQTVGGLIDAPIVDSVRSLLQNQSGCTIAADGYCYAKTVHQYLNVGDIRNQGWEAQGTLNAGPFSATGTYSLNKSRMIGITPKYRATLTDAQYRPGASFYGPAEHTWALTTTYARAGNTLTLGVNGTGALYRLYDDRFYLQCNGRLDASKANKSCSLGGRPIAPGYAMADLNAAHRFSRTVEGLIQVNNLANFYRTDNYDRAYAVMGRQTKAGLRVKL